MTANPAVRSNPPKPTVSVIVPARNEEASLGACLESLVAQSGIRFEIIVVNDNSTDRTREIALSFSGVRVVDADPLPAGWTGKSHALFCGVQVAQGEWLLFTDADTVHLPASLLHAVLEAQEHAADMLSYSPKQEVETFWERALMPVIFAELWRRYPPKQVRNPSSKIAAANGQYILIRHDTYLALGGHQAIRESLLEDVELARRAKAAGVKIRFRYGADAVKTRMYRNFDQLLEGWTKNLVLLFPYTQELAFRRGVECFLLYGGFLVFLYGVDYESPRIGLVGAILGFPVLGSFFARIRNAHFDWVNTLISPAGLPLFVLLLLRSHRHHLNNRVSWKGRDYGSGSQGSVSEPEETVTSE
jgi:glycosyltransferase involved in cell wall biosynthesis